MNLSDARQSEIRAGCRSIIPRREHDLWPHATRPAPGGDPGARTAGAAVRRLAALSLAALLLGLGCFEEARAAEKESCVTCHSDPELLVTNKKLYDYYQQWDGSIHDQEEVTCDDCHGGNPRATDKKKAHASGVGAADPKSGIHYTAIPETCGQCHDDILEGFQESEHFAHVEKEEKGDKQGPTCVTCHGGINVEVLNVNTVEEVCARCHNQKSENNPEVPEEARHLLNRFLSIHRFYRYITTNAESDEASAFFRDLDPRLHDLTVTWHTFDLEAVEEGTGEVLKTLKAKREEIRARRSKGPKQTQLRGVETETGR
jgi:hypothetical protein